MSGLSTEQLLLDLKAKDIQIWIEGDRLRVSAPKDGMPSVLREELASRKQEILDFLITSKISVNESIPSLVATEDDSPAPLSFGQQRIWLHHELSKEQKIPYDTLVFNIRMQGLLDVDALNFSLVQIIRRHEILRATVDFYQEQPVQRILDVEQITLEFTDLTDKNNENRDFHMQQVLKDAKTTLFDLETGPLFKTQLVKFDENDHLLIMIIHHMIFDAWSMTIFTRELMALYEGYQQGNQQPLAEPVLQYKDFSRWQRQWLQGDELNRHLSYWKDKLADVSVLDLPVDFSRPAEQTYNGDIESLRLSGELSEKLIKLGQRNNTTVYVSMLTTFGLFLSRYTGQTDIAIGTQITNRDSAELQELVGFFLNTLVLRLDHTGEVDFLTLLDRCRRTTLDAFSHQHLPFEKLLDELQLERDPSRSPLFQVSFALNGAPDTKPLKLKGLELGSVPERAKTTRFDIEVYVIESPEGLGISFIYNTDLFKAETIRRMLAHYHNLLKSIVDDAEQPVHMLTMLDDSEYRKIVCQWNQTQQSLPHDRLVHQSVENIAFDYATHPAVIGDKKSLDYAALNNTANQLAHYLLALNANAETPVTVLMERTPEMIIALLAILKTGSHYLPVDPECPEKRLTYMLDDTKSNIVITQSDLASRVGNYSGHVVCMDDIAEKLKIHSIDNTDVLVTPDHVAYIIYTSGSTGQPKGVEITHAGLSNLVAWHQREYQQGLNDRASHLAGLGFDATVWETWPNITCGTSLYLVPDELRLSVSGLWQWIVEQGITLSFMPTPLAEAVLAEIPSDTLTNPDFALRVLHIAGDKLHGALSKQALPFRVANLYGPTENTVCATFVDIDVLDESEPAIGRPIDNVHIYILDNHMLPVPVGVTGNLYIGGNSLAKGYLNQPELNTSQFVKNPFSKAGNECLYNTGDLAKYRDDGLIEFAGRSDSQVKLRGFRIELGEIESVLTEFSGVSTAVVIIREDVKGDKRLVAYAVSKGGRIPYTELRAYIEQKLPQYMVPAIVEWLDEMPLTPNGKIDYRKLPVPSHTQKRTTVSNNKPESEMEIIMANIWEELLEIDDIETNDMFFDLGGHSLLTLKVVEKFENETGIRLRPVNLINQTLRQLAAGAGASKNEADKTSESGLIGSIKKTLLKRE